jgi:hypothetical protein
MPPGTVIELAGRSTVPGQSRATVIGHKRNFVGANDYILQFADSGPPRTVKLKTRQWILVAEAPNPVLARVPASAVPAVAMEAAGAAREEVAASARRAAENAVRDVALVEAERHTLAAEAEALRQAAILRTQAELDGADARRRVAAQMVEATTKVTWAVALGLCAVSPRTDWYAALHRSPRKWPSQRPRVRPLSQKQS